MSTLSRHTSLNRAIPSASISRFPEMPSFFSASISTGSPCVSHPAMRGTHRPRMVRKRATVSLMVRLNMWWIPGRPLAVGGPS